MDQARFDPALPAPQGLYHPQNEKDACGLGFIVNIDGTRSHSIIEQGIQILINLTHRGACGCDPDTGDGAGILIQIPHKFFAKECDRLGFTLPPQGKYGVGMCFLPVNRQQRLMCKGILERVVEEEGLEVLGWRDTPINSDAIGRLARDSQPYIEQIFIGCTSCANEDELERRLYVVRKRAEKEIAAATEIRDRDFF
jgi:glutamate synthase domain-containing protein 1